MIRSYGEVERFRSENLEKLNMNYRAAYYFEMAARWLGLRLDIVVCLMVTGTFQELSATNILIPGVAVMLVFFELSPALAGVAMIYAIRMGASAQWMVRVSIEAENQFTSVEVRLCWICDWPLSIGAYSFSV